MKLVEAAIDRFTKEPVQTEGTAYRLLKAHPLASDTTFLAAPWSVFLNHGGMSAVSDLRIEGGGFTVCQHIRYQEIIPILQKIGIDTLFTPHVCANHAIRVLPFPHYAVNACDPVKKNILISFIGAPTHKVRGPLFTMRGKNVVVKKRSKWFFECGNRQPLLNEYLKTLARTRFSLCPRGTGASTIRFWESLRAGAIPVLLSDAMRLPEGFDWNRCVIKIPEKDVNDTAKVIKSLSMATEAKMRVACLEAYKLFSGENFVRCIRIAYGESQD